MTNIEFYLKIVGMFCLTIISCYAFYAAIKAPIDKFGGGKDNNGKENMEIIEVKRKTLFKFNINACILALIAISLIGHFLVPDVLTSQVSLVILIASITSLGIKIGLDLKS